jgi:hypothetical protein
MNVIPQGTCRRMPSKGQAHRRTPAQLSRYAIGVALLASSIALLLAMGAYADPTPGYYIAGDGSGGGGGGSFFEEMSDGGAGAGDADTIAGTGGADVIFGDGSGGGAGGGYHSVAVGGAGGSGADTITAGGGSDIVFGDGFDGQEPQGVFDAGAGGFGGGGGGGGGSFDFPGSGGAGGVLGGGGGASMFGGSPGDSLYGGGDGGSDSKPTGGSSYDDDIWGGFSATPTAGDGWFSEQSLGGTGYNSEGGAGGAGFGGLNDQTQYIASEVTRSANGGRGEGGGSSQGSDGSATHVRYEDVDGDLWDYVYGQRSEICSSTSGTTNGVGAGADSIDGGAGSDELFGLGGDDTFVFERNDAGSSDVDTIWDFDRLSEADKLALRVGGALIGSSARDALIAAQSASGSDRSIVFSDGGSHSVTITVKRIGRDLTTDDFTAVPQLTVLTTGASGVTSTTATGTGNVTSDGGLLLTARGLCWGTSASPTTGGSHSADGTGTGAFSTSITGLSGNTRYHLRAYATNSEETTYGSDVVFYYDNGPPSTTASGLAGSSTTGWVNATPTVSFSATDTLSGVADTEYALGGGGWTTYSTPIEVGGEDGSHAVAYRSTDASGNVEATQTGYVNLDRAAPDTSDDHVAEYYHAATIHLSAVDTLSGSDYTRYVLDSDAPANGTVVTCSTAGTHTLEYASTDVAGNTEASKTVEFAVIAKGTFATSMSLNGSSRIRKGRRYSLSTLVLPASAPGNVRFTVKRLKGGRWRTVRTVSLRLSSGLSVYRFYPYYRGTWRITATYAGATSATAVWGACSATKRLKVY